VTTALKNYEGILDALTEVSEDSTNAGASTEARALFEQFRKKCQMYFYLMVAKTVFEPADRLSVALQSAKMTATEGIEVVRVTNAQISGFRSDTTFDKLMAGGCFFCLLSFGVALGWNTLSISVVRLLTLVRLVHVIFRKLSGG